MLYIYMASHSDCHKFGKDYFICLSGALISTFLFKWQLQKNM